MPLSFKSVSGGGSILFCCILMASVSLSITNPATLSPSFITIYLVLGLGFVAFRENFFLKSISGMTLPRRLNTPKTYSGTLGTRVYSIGLMISWIFKIGIAYSSSPTIKPTSWTISSRSFSLGSITCLFCLFRT